MQFAIWEPLYLALLEDFGFSMQRDEEAAKLLAELLRGSEDWLPAAELKVRGKDVVVFGNAPTLDRELKGWQEKNSTLIAADGATAVLLRHGILPDIVVTDLDGPFPDILKANQEGCCIVVVHAHGDNLDALQKYVPQLERVIGTAQCRPPEGLHNFGGFTDGDRCVFLAEELGAASIKLIGFDFEDESVTFRKKRKLFWAKKLIELAMSRIEPRNCEHR